MSARKYGEISVFKDVYVSSSCDYHFHLHIQGYGRVIYDPSMGFYVEDSQQDPSMNRFPQYVRREVDRQILERFKAADTIYYEYDRDHNKRYENLRYHDNERVNWWIEIMEKAS